ncbi:MAG: glycerol kinase GlpK [Lachnospiraceae bacterium]|nr:glycerol kinase GlpK [Lachnospiraceae bacterium]
MGEKYILALDQGTTSSRGIIFDKDAKIKAVAQKEFDQYYPQPGWVEHNPREIWSSQISVAREAMANLGLDASDIAAIGITNQRETTIVWDRETGEPVYNAIVWQCRRTAPMIDKLVAAGRTDMIVEKTGLVPDAYFSASKIAWILDNVDGAREKAEKGRLVFGTVDTWLIWNLTGGLVHVTDYTNAARTMLFNIHTLQWDKDLLKLFNIPKSMLPEVKPSSAQYGYTSERVMGGWIPISGSAGDQQAALFGQCCFDKGDVKNTYGTGSFILMNTGSEPVASSNGLLTTMAACTSEKPEYALEGSVFVAGAAVQWLRDSMRMVKNAAQTEEYADRVRDSAGVYVVPAFTGMGAPYWDQYARGTVFGITRGCTKEHFIRATLESIAYQSYDVMRAMEEDLGAPLQGLKVDGGASANNFLVKFQADLIGTRVIRPKCIETTAMGAAFLAGLAVGYYKNKDEIRDKWELGRAFEPEADRSRAEELLKGWHKAVKYAIAWSKDE